MSAGKGREIPSVFLGSAGLGGKKGARREGGREREIPSETEDHELAGEGRV
jgi:hypothetical protein